jgi:hypothetical protein
MKCPMAHLLLWSKHHLQNYVLLNSINIYILKLRIQRITLGQSEVIQSLKK